MAQKTRSESILDSAIIEASLIRAAKAARRLSRQTGTPFIVCRDGKIVDLNSEKTNGAGRRRKISPEKRPKLHE